MKTTVKLINGDNGKTSMTMTINSGSLDLIGNLIENLYPEEDYLYIKFRDIQIDVSLGYEGYFTNYAVSLSDGDFHTVFDLETASEVWELVRDYLTNAIETERAVQACR